MSSQSVRTAFKDFLAANSNESIIDLTAAYDDVKGVLAADEIQPDAPWLGLQFTGGEENPVSLAATNDQGSYREEGGVTLHVCAVARIGVGDSLIARGDVLRNLLRGRRIGSIVIEKMTAMNTDEGATLQFEGGYVSGSFQVFFHSDLNL